MNINYKFNGEQTRHAIPKSVTVLVHIILGIIMSAGLLLVTLLAQIVIYICAVIVALVG